MPSKIEYLIPFKFRLPLIFALRGAAITMIVSREMSKNPIIGRGGVKLIKNDQNRHKIFISKIGQRHYSELLSWLDAKKATKSYGRKYENFVFQGRRTDGRS